MRSLCRKLSVFRSRMLSMHVPEYTKDTIVQIHEAQVGGGNPNIEQVNDKLVSDVRSRAVQI